MNYRRIIKILAVTIILGLISASGSAVAGPARQGVHTADNVYPTISYQGRLTNSAGEPLNGTFNLLFQLYDAPSGGTKIWEQPKNGVQVNDGLFTVELDVDPNHFAGQGLWLAITVNGQLLSPRQELHPAPYALTLRPGATVGNPSGTALYAITAGSYALQGWSSGNIGLLGVSGISFTPPEGMHGVHGIGNVGVYGEGGHTGTYGKGDNDGVKGESTNGNAVHGISSNGYGVLGESTGSAGVRGSSVNGYGGWFSSSNDHYDLVLGGHVGRINTNPNDQDSNLILSSNNDVDIRLDNDSGENGVFRIKNSGGQAVFTVDEQGNFNATGTSHVLVISGANITIVAALFSLIFGRLLGKRRAYWLTLAGIALYVLLVGADAAVVRAGLMGGLFVTALYLGRRATAYVSLLATAVLLTLLNPLALWDVGFQLSFAATLSLILFTPLLERWFERGLSRFTGPERARRGVRLLSGVLIVTLAAQVLTLPLVAYRFGRLSLVAPLANLLILPVQMPIMIGGGLAAILGLVPALQPLAQVVAWLPWLSLTYTTAVVRWLARWPWASVEIERGAAAWLALIYLALLVLGWLVVRAKRRAARPDIPALPAKATWLALGLLLAAAILTGLALAQLPDGRLHVAFLDVGQGDAILITTPTGQQVLLDGGPSPAALTSALGREMPFWDRSLDLVIMSHPDADHITGLVSVLERYRVDGWADSGYPDDDAVYARCLELLQEQGVPRYQVRAGERFDLGQGIALEVLHPPPTLMVGSESDSNNNSLVVRLVWGEASFLLTGDVEAEGERLLLHSGQPLEADVLKVAHHGSGGSSTEAFLAAVAPRYAVISVGADNHFGHPAPAVLERLGERGATIVRTDEQGTVEFTTDGRRLWLRTDR